MCKEKDSAYSIALVLADFCKGFMDQGFTFDQATQFTIAYVQGIFDAKKIFMETLEEDNG